MVVRERQPSPSRPIRVRAVPRRTGPASRCRPRPAPAVVVRAGALAPCRSRRRGSPGTRTSRNAVSTPRLAATVPSLLISARRHEHGVGERRRGEGFAEPARRQGPRVGDVLHADDEQVGPPRKRQMLKPVVEHVHRGIEVTLGQAPGEIAVAATPARGRPRRRARASAVRRRSDRDRRRAGVRPTPPPRRPARPARVPAAQNRRPLAHLQQHARDMSHGRRLAGAADAEVADADDRPLQTPLPAGAPMAPSAVPMPQRA